MASHKAWDRHLVTNQGLTMTDGYSTRLAKGQIGIFDMSTENQTKLGNPAIADFAAQPADRKFEVKVGVHDNGLGRSQTNKSMSTIPFTLGGVQGLSVSVSDLDEKVYDEWLIGYNGSTGSELKFNAGETTEVSVLLKGEPLGVLGYFNAELLLKMHFTAPQDEAEVNNEKIVTEAVKAFKREEFMGQFPINELLEITPINSSNPATVDGDEHKLYEIEVEDLGDSNALGVIQASYPEHIVRKTDRKGLVSTYTMLVKTVMEDDGTGTGTNVETSVPADFDGKSWTVKEVGTAVTEKYTIRLADKNGTDSRLADLQAAYPDLTITETAVDKNLCQREYETTTASNVVFEECDPAFRDLFETEAPETFDFVDWDVEEKVWDATAKMGIRIKGKDFTLSPNGEALRHQFPYYNSSLRIEVAGGYPIDVNESFAHYKGGVMPIKLVTRAQEPSNLGADLMDWETRGNAYFTNGNDPKHDNLFARSVYGRESNLDELTQYVTYAVKIGRTKFSQGFNGTQSENFTYHIVAPKGKHQDIEALLNSLATKVGIPTVEAYPV